MFTVRFFVPGLRPDFARFDTDAEAARAADNLINRMHKLRPIRVNISHKGKTVYAFERH